MQHHTVLRIININIFVHCSKMLWRDWKSLVWSFCQAPLQRLESNLQLKTVLREDSVEVLMEETNGANDSLDVLVSA